jgi:hypothetical protein
MMQWHWNWSVFFTALIFFTGLIALIRVVTNQDYINDYGSQADYRTALRERPISLACGTAIAAAVYAFASAVVFGFI